MTHGSQPADQLDPALDDQPEGAEDDHEAGAHARAGQQAPGDPRAAGVAAPR